MRVSSDVKRARLRAADTDRIDLDIHVGGALWELIEPGQYDAIGVGYRKFFVFNTWKVALDFDVLVRDEAAESGLRNVRLSRFYNVKRGPEKRVLASPRGDYLREWVLVAGRRPSRHDRLSPRIFVGVLVAVEVETVDEDHRQRGLLDVLKYSRIARIIERRAGGGIL